MDIKMKKKILIFSIITISIIILFKCAKTNKDDVDVYRPIVVENFTNNIEKFINIQQFVEKYNINLYVYIVNEKVIYREEQMDIIRSAGIKDDIEFILLKLKYYAIYGSELGDISFMKAGVDREIGIYYIKNGVTPDIGGSSGGYEKIKNNWFFFYHNNV